MWSTCRLAASPQLAQNWATPILPVVVNLHSCLHLMSSHGSATADASVIAPSPFAVKLSVGAVGAVEPVGGGGALPSDGKREHHADKASWQSALQATGGHNLQPHRLAHVQAGQMGTGRLPCLKGSLLEMPTRSSFNRSSFKLSI